MSNSLPQDRREKRSQLECPYQDSNLGRRGIAKPQHDDLTTNLYGPKYRGANEVPEKRQEPCLENILMRSCRLEHKGQKHVGAIPSTYDVR